MRFINSVVVHPTSPGTSNSNSYTIEVRSRKQHQHPRYTVQPWVTTVSEANTTTGGKIIHDSNVAYFDFCGPIDITLTYNALQSGPRSTIRFSLDNPKNLVVQVNNGIWNVLHLFTSSPDTDIPKRLDPDLLVPSGENVYLAPGGTVKIPLLFHNVANAGIRGRGLVQGAHIDVTKSSNIPVRDVLLASSNIGSHMYSAVTVRDLCSFSCGPWWDGMDYYCSRNILVDNVFMRNSDDNIAIYQHRKNDTDDSFNLTIQNFFFPGQLHTPDQHRHARKYQQPRDNRRRNDPQHRRAQSPRAPNVQPHPEYPCRRLPRRELREGRIVNIRGIRNVYIKDLSYTGTNANLALLLGYDTERTISNVTFENLVVNGRMISNKMPKPSGRKPDTKTFQRLGSQFMYS
ncbi:hypothetical protein BDV12DRAFT_187000 [Aspergillus spectabilis]